MKLLFTCILSILSFIIKADDFISGNKIVTPGSVETYTANWPSWGGVYESYANVTWTVNLGTILSSDKHTVTIQWDNIPRWQNGAASIEVYEDLGSQTGVAYVNIQNFIEGILENCNGVLGTPAIFENFGVGSNPGPPLSTVSTSYQYISNCILFPGQYTRTNSTVGCRGNWLGLPQDHTPGDVNGYMLMVDGNDNSGEVYRTTATGLTQAFAYEFSAYLANLTDLYEDPGLKFAIYDLSNNLIQESGVYRIHFDPGNPWQKISFMFNLPTGTTSVQVVLINDNNDELGNDFVIDDLSFAPCYPPIIASFSNTLFEFKSYICNNGTVNLYSRWPTTTIPYSNPSFKWQRSLNGGSWADISGATTMNYTRTESTAGIYQYRMYAYETSNPSQFVISNVITYYVQKMVVNAKTYHVYNCNPNAVQLNPAYDLQYKDNDPGATTLSYTFAWSPGTYLDNTSIANPYILLPSQPTPDPTQPVPPPINYPYTLTVQETTFGCIASNNQIVIHNIPRKVAVPNAFTPNGNGINDFFVPINLSDYPEAQFWVWDRWGGLIYHSTGPTYSWDGKYTNGQPCEMDTYVWQVLIPGCPYNIINGDCGGCSNPYGNVVLIR